MTLNPRSMQESYQHTHGAHGVSQGTSKIALDSPQGILTLDDMKSKFQITWSNNASPTTFGIFVSWENGEKKKTDAEYQKVAATVTALKKVLEGAKLDPSQTTYRFDRATTMVGTILELKAEEQEQFHALLPDLREKLEQALTERNH